MCARRFLIFVFILILLFVAGAFAIYQFGQQVLIKQATPQGHFEAPSNGKPDYSKAENWIASEDLPNDPSHWRPANDQPVEPIAVDARVFYVHPTTYLRRDHWNAPLLPDADTESRTRLFVQSEASVFSQDAAVWAPRYRQAAFGAFLLRNEDAQKALDLAFSDVAAAFDEFLKRNPSGPIILAAHSQGSLHLSRLLRERAPQLKDRLVAAYVVGWPLSVTADLPAIGLSACASPDQTGCVLSWQSFGQPANPDLIITAWEGTKGLTGINRERKERIAIRVYCSSTGQSRRLGHSPCRATIITSTTTPCSGLRSGTTRHGGSRLGVSDHQQRRRVRRGRCAWQASRARRRDEDDRTGGLRFGLELCRAIRNDPPDQVHSRPRSTSEIR
jgi:hypothetical protein